MNWTTEKPRKSGIFTNMEEDDKKDSGDNVISEIKITLKQNGSISVDGPVNNFVLFRHMMNAAERSVLDSIAHKVFEKDKNRIVVPGMQALNG